LIDEDVPRAIGEYLATRAHAVVRVVEVLAPSTPDRAVVDYADQKALVVVTFNLKDYNRLISRDHRRATPPRAGLIGFRCEHPLGLERLKVFIEHLEFEHTLLAKGSADDRRLIAQISDTTLKLVR
ncbi:MAG TPA: DUF5615 family PIN-like protein, partial [Polyangiaceae bacterium]